MNSVIENQKIERIILDSETVSVIKTISDQINLELGDMVQVTQKSVANFIIRKRFHLLSKEEISEFLSENYDLVKALKHATQEAIKAKQNGNNIEINDILKLIQTPSVNPEMSFKKTRGRKKKISVPANTDGENELNDDSNIATGEIVNKDLRISVSDPKFDKSKTTENPYSP